MAIDSDSTRSAARILIVDPQPAVRQILGELLSPFYHLSLASGGESAVEKLEKQRIDLVLTDDQLCGPVNTRELIRQTQVNFAKLPVVVLSKEKLPDDGVIGVGSCFFLSKKRIGQESGRAELLLLVERRLRDYHQERASAFRRRQHQRTGLAASSFLVGRSPQLDRVREQALRAARSGLSLLITGETGVGKTLVAENVHMVSAGPTRPFVTVDPSALAPSLFESELFGHARGA
ncbi:MAG: sigma 54-interacting transcriptional regulator, partial [Myxococcota bacterium]